MRNTPTLHIKILGIEKNFNNSQERKNIKILPIKYSEINGNENASFKTYGSQPMFYQLEIYFL